MIFVFITLIICFSGCAAWFWTLSQAQIGHFVVELTTTIEQKITLHSIRSLRRTVTEEVLSHVEDVLGSFIIDGGCLFRLLIGISIGLILFVITLVVGLLTHNLYFWLINIFPVLISLEFIIGIILTPLRHGPEPLWTPPTFNEIFRSWKDPQSAKYRGTFKLPKRVYEGDSQNISLIFRQRELAHAGLPETLEVDENTGIKSGELQALLTLQKDPQGILEIEMLAAGLTVSGDVKQQQSLANEFLEYRWNCAFPNAGFHEMALALRVIHGTRTYPLGAIEKKVKVVKFDHATQRQVRFFAILAGVAIFLSTVLTIATSIHTWYKP